MYDFSIEYRSGKKNKDADPLSRLWEDSRGETDDDMDKIPFNVVKTVCGEMDSCELKSHLQNVQVSNVDWRNRQLNDTSISRIIQYVESGTKPSVRERRLLPVSIKLLLRSLDKYVMRNGILYRRRMVEEKEHYQLVLPEAYHKEVLHGLHDDMAHLGVDRTTSLVRDRYYWPKMLQDIENHIKICERCIKRKKPYLPEVAPLVPITTNRPLELVTMDYLQVEKAMGYENILVLVDHFSKFVQAYATKDQKAVTTATSIHIHFISRFGIPERFHSDKGKTFVSNVMKLM